MKPEIKVILVNTSSLDTPDCNCGYTSGACVCREKQMSRRMGVSITFEEFLKKLYEAGWSAPGDAQHTNIKKLWEELFNAASSDGGKEHSHRWVANSGRGGDPFFRLDSHVGRPPTMHVQCSVCGDRTWFTSDQWDDYCAEELLTPNPNE